MRSVSFREGTHIGRIEQPEKYGFFVDERVVTVIDYLPEHREAGELPLQTVRRADSSGMRVPTVGLSALAAVLGESAQGDINEPTLCVVTEAERNNAGMATLNTPS